MRRFSQGGPTHTELSRELGRKVVEAQLLIEGGEALAAANVLRRIEAALPVSPSSCPVTRAARSDIAALELTRLP